MRMLGSRCTSPSYSLSTPAMMRMTVDLPEPFKPSRPILAPGKKEREMFLMICRFGGTILLTRSIDITYWAILLQGCENRARKLTRGRPGPGQNRTPTRETDAWD